MSCLPFNPTSFRFDNASTWLSVQVTFAHLPHLSHQHCYLILYQIGYWISASGFTLGLELAIRQDGFAFSGVNLRKGLRMSCGRYINLGPRGCGSYMEKQGNGQEIMTVSREGRSLAGQTWRVRNSEKQLQVGSLLNALCQVRDYACTSPQTGATVSILLVSGPNGSGGGLEQVEKTHWAGALDWPVCLPSSLLS